MHAFYLRNINRTTRHLSLCVAIMQFSNIIYDFVRFCEIVLYIERKLCTKCYIVCKLYSDFKCFYNSIDNGFFLFIVFVCLFLSYNHWLYLYCIMIWWIIYCICMHICCMAMVNKIIIIAFHFKIDSQKHRKGYFYFLFKLLLCSGIDCLSSTEVCSVY